MPRRCRSRDDDDYAALSARLADLSGELVVRALDALAANELEFVEQDEAAATYAEKISPEERRLDPARSATELERIVGALTPHIGAYLELEDGSSSACDRRVPCPTGPPGARSRSGRATSCSAPSDGALRLDTVQPAGKKPMSAADFLRGHDVPAKAV